jgi:mono/diheme cytochrome c family protein
LASRQGRGSIRVWQWGEAIVELSIVAGALVALVLVGSAAAQEAGDPAAGHALASKFCSSCHIVGAERVGSDAAPPFRAIAADPSKALTELHAWRGPMHPVLSNLALSRQQIADINAYLDSLRPSSEPATTAPTQTSKPPPAIQNAPPEKLGSPVQPKPK